MNKDELVSAIATKTGSSKNDAKKFLDGFLEVVGETLRKEETIQLVGHLTLSVTKTPARKGRNPKTGKPIDIAASKRIKFSAGKLLKDTVNS